MRLFWNLTWFQLRVHGPALVDVRRFHHVTLHVYLRMHNRSLTGKHCPKLSSYSWFCLGKKTRWKQNDFFASLHHHALCASSEGSFEMRSWWHLAMTGYIQYKISCPLDVQIIAVLTQKTSYLIDFLCTIYFLAIDEVLPLASVRFRSRLQPSNSCLSEKTFWKVVATCNRKIHANKFNPMEKLGLLQWTKPKSPLAACTIRYTLRQMSFFRAFDWGQSIKYSSEKKKPAM